MELTVAVITKNHPQSLAKCLAGISSQTVKNFAVLIVDNDVHKTAEPVFNHFKGMDELKLEYILEPVAGYSRARNCALNNCNTRFLGFVDDDCILDKNWVEKGLDAIKKYNSAYVSGLSENTESGRVFEKVERYFTARWWSDTYDKNTYELKQGNLDTKNVILDSAHLKEYNIEFDEIFNRYGGEDTDLSFQIRHKSLKGYYVPGMKLSHEEISGLKRFCKKAFSYGYNCHSLFRKWSPKKECKGWDDCRGYRFINSWRLSFTLKQGSIFKNISFFFTVQLFNFFYLKGFYKSKGSA